MVEGFEYFILAEMLFESKSLILRINMNDFEWQNARNCRAASMTLLMYIKTNDALVFYDVELFTPIMHIILKGRLLIVSLPVVYLTLFN